MSLLTAMLTDDRAEQALRTIALSDERFADLKAAMGKKEYLIKLAESKAYLETDGTVAERKAKAELVEAVVQANYLYFDAVAEFEKIKAKREFEYQVLEVWRSVVSGKGKGTVL